MYLRNDVKSVGFLLKKFFFASIILVKYSLEKEGKTKLKARSTQLQLHFRKM